jgi:hypothetical protein
MTILASDKQPTDGHAVELGDSGSSVQVDEAAVRRLVRKTDLILMPVLSM